jgi:hypothetical protein
MAKQQKMRDLEDEEILGFNLSSPVGRGGLNERDDVMLIQALLVMIGEEDRSHISREPGVSLPSLTGILDGATSMAIIAFQLRWMHLLLATISGWVPPMPAGYWLKGMHDRRPVMAMMNELAWDAKGSASITLPQFMANAFPELTPLLKH